MKVSEKGRCNMWSWLQKLMRFIRGEEEQVEMDETRPSGSAIPRQLQAKTKSIYPRERETDRTNEEFSLSKQRNFRFPVVPDHYPERSNRVRETREESNKAQAYIPPEQERKSNRRDSLADLPERTQVPKEKTAVMPVQHRKQKQPEKMSTPSVPNSTRLTGGEKRTYQPSEIVSPVYGKITPATKEQEHRIHTTAGIVYPRQEQEENLKQLKRWDELKKEQAQSKNGAKGHGDIAEDAAKSVEPLFLFTRKEQPEAQRDTEDVRQEESSESIGSGLSGEFPVEVVVEAPVEAPEEAPVEATVADRIDEPVKAQVETPLESLMEDSPEADRERLHEAAVTVEMVQVELDEPAEMAALVEKPVAEDDEQDREQASLVQASHGEESMTMQVESFVMEEESVAMEGLAVASEESMVLDEPAIEAVAEEEPAVEESVIEATSVEEPFAMAEPAVVEVPVAYEETLEADDEWKDSVPDAPMEESAAAHLLQEDPLLCEKDSEEKLLAQRVEDADVEHDLVQGKEEAGIAAHVQPSFSASAAVHTGTTAGEAVGTGDSLEKAEEPREPAYHLPELELLNPSPEASGDDDEHTQLQKLLLEETLANFNVSAQVVGIVKGPSVTRFELQPAPGVKVNKITGLIDDIKLNLAAKDIRIEAPIPGRNAIGIEVPNLSSRPVLIEKIIGSEKFQQHASPLAVALGMDIGGEPIVADIKKMPHGLIAGSTGSGKSVCINSIIVSLLYKATPEQVRLLLIDPKMVELAPYNNLPHLVTPVVTEAKQATAALKWAVEEMEKRYALFVDAGVRDIDRYNQTTDDVLPYIVIVIDELADLMMVSPQDVEDCIIRIAQKARACGIHLLLATQRPSVDVITGNIKANVPTRLAFAVFSQVDSRTILDQSGAERLLGRGDMLFLESGTTPLRLQGNFVSDDEIERITQRIKKQRKPSFLFSKEDLEHQVQSYDAGDDPLYMEALMFVAEQGHASASGLQRRFRVGYNRAARLIEMMEADGYVAGQSGGKARAVLITLEDAQAVVDGSTLV